MSAYQLVSALLKAALGAIAVGLCVLALKMPISGALIFTFVAAALCSFEIRPAGAIGIAESVRLSLFAGAMALIMTPSFYLFNLAEFEAATMAFYVSQLTVAVLAMRCVTLYQPPKSKAGATTIAAGEQTTEEN